VAGRLGVGFELGDLLLQLLVVLIHVCGSLK
jgi:hypothetical protein